MTINPDFLVQFAIFGLKIGDLELSQCHQVEATTTKRAVLRARDGP